MKGMVEKCRHIEKWPKNYILGPQVPENGSKEHENLIKNRNKQCFFSETANQAGAENG